jgi:alkyl hydroperoxide reductase subunit AhpC
MNSPLSPSMQLLTVSNKITKPQDRFVFRQMSGVDKDGETYQSAVVDVETEFKNNYFVLFFFPMDFKVDSSKILSFKEHLEEFTKNHCDIVGVTSDSPLAVNWWISKDVFRGGFGGTVGCTIMTDKNLSLSMSMGVARDCRAPARATFIIDRTGTVRYMMVHRTDIVRSVKEILRLVQSKLVIAEVHNSEAAEEDAV